ncbi:MAG: class 1 fructose-bisphosphatase [Deltaproteobacteria bacterium]|nr:class 1 fructose-bisphosphatase [Deltaproteobacteria bacterium]
MPRVAQTTLTQHILHNQPQRFRGALSTLITQIGVAAKMIAAQVRRAGIIEVWGETGEVNVQGEEVQRLDRIANDTFISVLEQSGCVAAMASEEEDDWLRVPAALAGDYLVVFDPLDGSSNIDVSASIGTIFGVYACPSRPERLEDVLRPGRDMVAAGYVIYGSSTVFVYADGERVDCFTLDPVVGEFFLSRPNLRIPDTLAMVSANELNEPYWPAWTRGLMGELKERNRARRALTGRHMGSLVADFHRNLIKGGVFLYPVDSHNKRGKLRLLYECNPLAFIARAAGGADTWGEGSVLDLAPEHLHQRTGFVVGVAEAVARAEDWYARERRGELAPLAPPAAPRGER